MIYFKILAALFAFSLLCIALPIMLVMPDIGMALILSLPPMIVIVLSWMVPAQYIKMSNPMIIALTVGMIPMRVLIVCAYAYWCSTMGINLMALVIGMMWHWAIFSIPELMLLYKQGVKRYNL